MPWSTQLRRLWLQGLRRWSWTRHSCRTWKNYYGFATGTGIPLGSYDRNRGTWIAHDKGVVVEIVGETGGLAELDIDGDGVAEDQSVLDGWDISDHERAELLNLYAVGESLWRVRIPHFTQPWDKNTGVSAPEDAGEPNTDKPMPQQDEQNSCMEEGSIISCQNQTVIERVPIGGTPLHIEPCERSGAGLFDCTPS